jgi:hypothetical protein
VSFLRCLSFLRFLLFLALCVTKSHSQEELIWRNQTIDENSDSFLITPWPKYDIALLHDRYPLIVHLSNDRTQLGSVRWVDGAKSESVAAPAAQILLSSYSNISLDARDDQASLVYFDFGALRHVRFDGSQWGTPEPVTTATAFGTVSEFIVKLNPAGEPVIAAMHGSGSDSKVVIHERSGGVWTSTQVARNSGIQSIAFTLSPSGKKHVVYNSSFSSPEHLTETDGTWISQTLPYSLRIIKIVATEDGKLWFLGEGNVNGAPYSPAKVIGHLNGTTWSDLQVLPLQSSPVQDLCISIEGDVHVLFGSSVATLRNGAWSTRPTPETSKRLITDDEGSFHVISALETQVSYHVASKTPWETVEVTPATGGNYQLEGLVIDSQQRPVVLALDFSGSRPAFTGNGSAWNRQNLNIDTFYQPQFAYDSAGNLHAFSDPMYIFETYAAGPIPTLIPGVVTTINLSGGSGRRQSLFVDSQNRPHVSFMVEQGDGRDFYYGTKGPSGWTIEKVVTTDTRGEPHSAVAVTPAGTLYVFTPNGLYKKTGASWTRQFSTVESVYPYEKAATPVLVCGPDSTLYGLYHYKGALYGFVGNGTTFTRELIAGFNSYITYPSLTYTANGPVGALLDSMKQTLQITSMTEGGKWTTQTIHKGPVFSTFGPDVFIAGAADGTLHIASSKEYNLGDHNLRHQLVTYRLSPKTTSIGDLKLTQWKGAAGKFGFRTRLLSPHETNPIQLQTSENLTTWSRTFDLKNRPSGGNATRHFMGNGFQSDILLSADPSKPKAFHRLAQGSAILPP